MSNPIDGREEPIRGCVFTRVTRPSLVTVAMVVVAVLAIVVIGLLLGKQLGSINTNIFYGVMVISGCFFIGAVVVLLVRGISARVAARQDRFRGSFKEPVFASRQDEGIKNGSQIGDRDSKERMGREENISRKEEYAYTDLSDSCSEEEGIQKKLTPQEMKDLLQSFEKCDTSLFEDEQVIEYFFERSFQDRDPSEFFPEEFVAVVEDFFNAILSHTRNWGPDLKDSLAQVLFKIFLWKVEHVEAGFVSPPPLPKGVEEFFSGKLPRCLHRGVFCYHRSNGIDQDIKQVWKNAENSFSRCPVEIFQVESFFNALEVRDNQDMSSFERMSKGERHPLLEGPSVQKTNLRSFVAVGLLGRMGFNALNQVFRSDVQEFDSELFPGLEGCLRLTEKNVKEVAKNFCEGINNLESPCFDVRDPNESFKRDPKMSIEEIQREYERDFKNKPRVQFVLQSAPDSSGFAATRENLDSSIQEDLNRIEEGVAYANFVTMFEVALKEAAVQKKRGMLPQMGVYVHLTGVGGGGFANKDTNIERGFLRAATEYQVCLADAGVKVILHSVPENDVMGRIANNLDLWRG